MNRRYIADGFDKSFHFKTRQTLGIIDGCPICFIHTVDDYKHQILTSIERFFEQLFNEEADVSLFIDAEIFRSQRVKDRTSIGVIDDALISKGSDDIASR